VLYVKQRLHHVGLFWPKHLHPARKQGTQKTFLALSAGMSIKDNQGPAT